MNKHTEGPWVVCIEDGDNQAFTVFAECQLDENNRISANDFDHMYICTAGLNHENFEANARLIAAAPDLLKALERFIAFIDKRNFECESSMVRECKAAIAKAKV